MSQKGIFINRRTFVVRLTLDPSDATTGPYDGLRGQVECLELDRRQRIARFASLRAFIEDCLDQPDQASARKDKKDGL
ncbi:MAG: hypothetical protein ACSHW1_11600 [Yoonia sp.]|uniref:hypothetical protein n=1 Tax=Yoonia sp. TaxID=2212373 RepID=UPI003EF09575